MANKKQQLMKELGIKVESASDIVAKHKALAEARTREREAAEAAQFEKRRKEAEERVKLKELLESGRAAVKKSEQTMENCSKALEEAK